MSKFFKTLLIVLLVVVVILVGYRMKKNSESGSSAIRIGVLMPLTGSLASLGEDTKLGLDLAKEDLEKQFGKSINLIYEDSAGDAKVAIPAAAKLLDVDRVPLVIGGPGSSVNVAVDPTMESHHTPFVALSVTPKLNDAGPYTFKALPDIDGEVHRLVPLILKKGFHNAAVLYDSSSESITTGKNIFLKDFEAQGGKIVGVEGFDTKSVTDFRTMLTTLKAKNPDVLYVLSADKIGGPIFKQAKELGWPTPIFSWSVLESAAFLKGAGSAAEGLVITAFPFTCTDASPKASSYCERYKAKAQGRIPSYFGARAYDVLTTIVTTALQSPAHSLAEADGVAAVMQALSKPMTGSVSGDIQFDSTGSVRDENFVFRVVKDGKFVGVGE